MKSPHELSLRNQVNSIEKTLQPLSFAVRINEDSWKEYSVQLHFFDRDIECGHARLYYAPTKKSFRIDGRSIQHEELKDLIGITEPKQKNKANAINAAKRNHHGLHAYVDGSYIAGSVGYGFVILLDDEVVFEDCGSVDNPEYVEARQVAGELTAVGKVLQWCIKHSYTSITIHYDYAGIEEWARGRWRAKQNLTQRYAAFVASSGITIHFNKIASHTGDYWNDYADQLAKKGTEGK